MGILKLRDLNLIHDSKISLSGTYGNTVVTHVNHKEYEYEGLVCSSEYIMYGCCTNYSSRNNSRSTKYENSFIGLETKYFPSTYRNMELVTKWVDFMNNLFPFFDIKIVTNFNREIIDPEYWIEKKLIFNFDKDKIYFVIKKDITTNMYFNLFQLSLLRYFVSNEYYFMIYDCLRLRELKSLSKLSNWQIMDIARFGVQTNNTQFTNKNNSSYNYAFLRDYRSPIYNNSFVYKLSSQKSVISKLNKFNSQNTSTRQNWLLIDVIYLMKLFEDEEYTKLYRLIRSTKHSTSSINQISEWSDKQYNYERNFYQLNNRNFDFKEYEKTI